jgi:hypothetical protein
MKFSVIAFCLLMWVAGCTRPVAKPAVTVSSPALIAFLQGLTDHCAEKELNGPASIKRTEKRGVLVSFF